MKSFHIVPEIVMYDTCQEFAKTVSITDDDLVLTNRYIWEPYFGELEYTPHLVFVEEYGTGEPSDEMVEAIVADCEAFSYQRVIAIGGGTIIDISKLFALRQISPVHEYGMKHEEIQDFTDNVMTKQGRLMANNYTTLTVEDVKQIYEKLY